MRSAILFLPSSILVFIAVGCTVGPDHHTPEVAVPARFGAATRPAAPVDLAHWWTTFNDPQLDSLVAHAVEGNLDLKLAESRIREARALRGIVAADAWPGVNANGSFRRSRMSENAFDTGQGSGGQNFGGFAGPGDTTNLWQAGFDAAWEIDVFGGVRRSVEAAEADISARIEDRRDALVTLLAEVARNYLELRGYQQQIEIARRNVIIQQEAADVAASKARLAGGSELDVARAQAQVASTQSLIPQLEALRDQSAHRLAVLLGREPRALVPELAGVKPIAKGPPVVPPGLPSELLRRRPDIRRAEREIAAASARIGVATADLYPRFSITAALGLQSEKFSSLGDWGSRYWNLAPGVSWNVFDAGRIRSNIEVYTERERAALLQYEKTVLTALEEVESALVAYEKEQARRELLASAVERNRRAVELAKTLYQGGARDFLNVIDAERALALSEDQLVQSERLISTNLVSLYKALGGGWEPPHHTAK